MTDYTDFNKDDADIDKVYVIENGVIRTMRAPTRRRRDGWIFGVAMVVAFLAALGHFAGIMDALARLIIN